MCGARTRAPAVAALLSCCRASRFTNLSVEVPFSRGRLPAVGRDPRGGFRTSPFQCRRSGSMPRCLAIAAGPIVATTSADWHCRDWHSVPSLVRPAKTARVIYRQSYHAPYLTAYRSPAVEHAYSLPGDYEPSSSQPIAAHVSTCHSPPQTERLARHRRASGIAHCAWRASGTAWRCGFGRRTLRPRALAQGSAWGCRSVLCQPPPPAPFRRFVPALT